MDTGWRQMTFDLTPYSHSGLRIRFMWTILTGGGSAGGWNIDNVCFYDGSPPGQAPSADANLDIGSTTNALSRFGNPVSSLDCGPYYNTVNVGDLIGISVLGPAPHQPWILAAGDLGVGATPLPPLGQFDIGTAGFQGVTIIGNGFEPGIQNVFYFTNAFNFGGVQVYVPQALSGSDFAMQAIMFDPLPEVVITNAVEVTVN